MEDMFHCTGRFEHLRVPMLEVLSLFSVRGGRTDLTFKFSPRLRHLYLTSVVIGWTTGLVKGLETLEMEFRGAVRGPTVDDVLSILRECPDLGWFRWEDANHYTTHIPAQSTPPRVIHLNRLTELRLWLPKVVVTNLLANIHTPNCAGPSKAWKP